MMQNISDLVAYGERTILPKEIFIPKLALLFNEKVTSVEYKKHVTFPCLEPEFYV